LSFSRSSIARQSITFRNHGGQPLKQDLPTAGSDLPSSLRIDVERRIEIGVVQPIAHTLKSA